MIWDKIELIKENENLPLAIVHGGETLEIPTCYELTLLNKLMLRHLCKQKGLPTVNYVILVQENKTIVLSEESQEEKILTLIDTEDTIENRREIKELALQVQQLIHNKNMTHLVRYSEEEKEIKEQKRLYPDLTKIDKSLNKEDTLLKVYCEKCKKATYSSGKEYTVLPDSENTYLTVRCIHCKINNLIDETRNSRNT